MDDGGLSICFWLVAVGRESLEINDIDGIRFGFRVNSMLADSHVFLPLIRIPSATENRRQDLLPLFALDIHPEYTIAEVRTVPRSKSRLINDAFSRLSADTSHFSEERKKVDLMWREDERVSP